MPVLLRISVDVGGTFTDLVALDEDTGELVNIKVPSVPRNPEHGVTDALRIFLTDHDPSLVRMLGHATTIATNALLGQIDLELPRTGLVTTKGFRDVLEIGRQRRADVYNLFFQRPRMLVERQYRYEADERIEYDGFLTKKLANSELLRILEQVRADGIESIAVGFLNSYANPDNERIFVEAARREMRYVTASSEVSNEYLEYERFSTAVVNATLMPIIHRYITTLASDVKALGVEAPLYVMQSNGGLASVKVVSEKPCTIVESGPAAGVIAAAWVAAIVGERGVISFDMGGTTAKAGTVKGRYPEVVPEYEVAGHIHMGRLVKGSGYPVRFPFIDLAECSSGGGTIAWVDEGKVLHIGPTSAGAIPGPVCYGRGGTQPTITDANLILGRLNPSSLLSGGMKIHLELARDAMEVLSGKIGMGVEEATISIIRLANSMMGKILRIVSVERGYDPRGFAVVAFGGAGPMHVCALAEELEVTRIIIPPNPGMFSALGLLTADLFHDYTHPIVRKLSEIDSVAVDERYRRMETEGAATLASEGVPVEKTTFLRLADLRYLGQGYELTIDSPSNSYSNSFADLISLFHEKHREAYGYASTGEPVELVNLRLRAVGAIPKPKLTTSAEVTEAKLIETRNVYFESLGWVRTPIYDRGVTRWSNRILGPAVVEQYDATTVLYPNWTAESDLYRNLILRRSKQ
ncbi:MAG: hydantoinase/oxoprolinase family protein [Candidatus Bathyarchaeota archaeon]|nr:hydantoinase/oxoprolinase family protein [Candidatus Bathyarchaeota archaeon]